MTDKIGKGTTTLDMLYHSHPWLKEMILEQEAEILKLRREAVKWAEIVERRTQQLVEMRQERDLMKHTLAGCVGAMEDEGMDGLESLKEMIE